MTNTMTTPARAFASTALHLAHAGNPLAIHLGVWSERLALIQLAQAAEDQQTVQLSELGRAVNMSRAAITSLADRLETMELAERIADPKNRRRMYLQITEAGAELVRDGFAFVASDEKALVAA